MSEFENIRDARHEQPFEPSVLAMADGTTRVVRGREWLSIPPARRPHAVAFPAELDGGAEDEVQTHGLDLARVSEVAIPGIASRRVQSEEAGDPK